LQKGDVGYITQGYSHSIENIDSGSARILIGLNAGIYETIDLSHKFWPTGGSVRKITGSATCSSPVRMGAR
jgi:oxalate decarboxylase/phosphoglucose isomerase-like protein (cupin superfamily)